MTDDELYQTVNEAVRLLAAPPTDDDADFAFSKVAFDNPAVGANIVLLATVKALTESAPPGVASAIFERSASYAEEFAEQYQRAEAFPA